MTMGRKKECHYQTCLTTMGHDRQSVIFSEIYWHVESTKLNNRTGTTDILIRFESKTDRERFRKEYTTLPIYSETSAIASDHCFSGVPYIVINKYPDLETRVRQRSGRLSYENATRDVITYFRKKYVNDRSVYLSPRTSEALHDIAVLLDALMEVKHDD